MPSLCYSVSFLIYIKAEGDVVCLIPAYRHSGILSCRHLR